MYRNLVSVHGKKPILRQTQSRVRVLCMRSAEDN